MLQLLTLAACIYVCRKYLRTWSAAILGFVGLIVFLVWAFSYLTGDLSDAVAFASIVAVVAVVVTVVATVVIVLFRTIKMRLY